MNTKKLLTVIGGTIVVSVILAVRVATATAAPVLPVQVSCFPDELRNLRFAGGEAMAVADNYKSSLRYEEGADSIHRDVRERADASSPWVGSDVEYSFSFALTAATFRDGGDILYLAGIRESDCADIIEQWTFQPSTGAPVLRSAISPTTTPAVGPIGMVTPPFSFVPGTAGSGGYISPELRGTQPAPRRRVLYEGSGLGHVRSMVADPEGRFLLLQSHGDSGIYQLNLLVTPIPAPQLLFSASSTPALVTARRMVVYDIPAAGGRCYVLPASQGDVMPKEAAWVILKDPNNDGVFDAIESYTNAAWQASPLGDRTSWRDLAIANGYQFNW
jgi:hypothetical protein